MPRSKAENIAKVMDAGADFVFDTRKPNDLLAKLDAVTQPYLDSSPCSSNKTLPKPKKERTRAFIKIQDGCDRYCAYCIVPYVRGPAQSRPPSDVLAEVENHIRNQIQEIVLTGIQVAAYGYDTDNEKCTLPGLIKEINSIAVQSNLVDISAPRLRLSSIDPWAVDDIFIATIANSPTLCSHFHLSLQSGCNRTLARMNRRYTTHDYAKAAASLKALRPNMALTTDVIVGFPGETDHDFKESMRFVEEMAFSRIHVFEYSPREGTQAADFPSQVPSHIKSVRGVKMRTLAKDLQIKFAQAQIGTTTSVLFETKTNDFPETWQGNSDNYCLVQAQGINLENTIQNIRIIGITENELIGELISNFTL